MKKLIIISILILVGVIISVGYVQGKESPANVRPLTTDCYQPGVTALCRDGICSFSQRQGTCSSHGGIKERY